MHQKIVNNLSRLIFFVSVVICVFLTDSANTVGFWGPNNRAFIDLVIVGPLVFIALQFSITAIIKIRITSRKRALLISLNTLSGILLSSLIITALEGNSDFWEVVRFHDRHFSNSSWYHHLFPPYIGIFGICIASIANVSYQLLSNGPASPHQTVQNNNLRPWLHLSAYIPLLAYFMALHYLEQYIPQLNPIY